MAVTVTLSRLLCGIATAASLGAATLPNSIANRILIKNVAIIGGGASGSHAALRLKEDYGQSVIVVEKEARLVRAPVPPRNQPQRRADTKLLGRTRLNLPGPCHGPVY